MSFFPLDIWERVCTEFLDVIDIISLTSVCKHLNKLKTRRKLWITIHKRDFHFIDRDLLKRKNAAKLETLLIRNWIYGSHVSVWSNWPQVEDDIIVAVNRIKIGEDWKLVIASRGYIGGERVYDLTQQETTFFYLGIDLQIYNGQIPGGISVRKHSDWVKIKAIKKKIMSKMKEYISISEFLPQAHKPDMMRIRGLTLKPFYHYQKVSLSKRGKLTKLNNQLAIRSGSNATLDIYLEGGEVGKRSLLILLNQLRLTVSPKTPSKILSITFSAKDFNMDRRAMLQSAKNWKNH